MILREKGWCDDTSHYPESFCAASILQKGAGKVDKGNFLKKIHRYSSLSLIRPTSVVIYCYGINKQDD